MKRSTHFGVMISFLLLLYFMSPPFVGNFVSTLEADHPVRQGVMAFYAPAIWLGQICPPYQRLLIFMSVDPANPGLLDTTPAKQPEPEAPEPTPIK